MRVFALDGADRGLAAAITALAGWWNWLTHRSAAGTSHGFGSRGIRSAFAAAMMQTLLAITVVSGLGAACMDVDPPTGSEDSALSAQDWTGPISIAPPGSTHAGAAVAALGGTTYVVYTEGTSFSDDAPVYFTRQLPDQSWAPATVVPGAVASRSNNELSLVAYGGSLYLATWKEGSSFTTPIPTLSRWDSVSGAWSLPSHLPFFGRLTGAAVHDGRLVLAWTDAVTASIKLASIDVSGALAAGPMTPFVGSNADVASYGGRLYLAYTTASSVQDVVLTSFDGTSWGAPQPIATGFGGILHGRPRIAAYSTGYTSCLHLGAKEQWGDPEIWWTYHCGSTWALPVTIPGSDGNRDWCSFALGMGAGRLFLLHRAATRLDLVVQTYTYPPVAKPPKWIDPIPPILK